MTFRTEEQGGKLKPAGYEMPYTAEQKYELIIRCPDDPIYFITTYCWIISTRGGQMLFDLYDYQRNLVLHYLNHEKTITLLSRQVGKTETSVAFLLWWAIFKPHQTILIASYKADFAKAIMARLKFMYEELPWWLKPGIKLPGGYNVMSVEFENGSKIIAETTTENTGRGYPVNLFYLDEFAYVPPNIAEAFWTSIFPTITGSPDCRCIITSTANTDEDKFAQIWFNSRQSAFSGDTAYTKRMIEEDAEEPDFETYWENEELKSEYTELNMEEDSIHGFWGFHVPWNQVPGRDEEFKQGILASGYSEEQWGRDYECKFLTDNPTLISATKLLALNSVVRPPRFVDKWGMRWYEEIKPSTNYGVILDPSEGVGRDDACIQVVELPSNSSSQGFLQVAEWNSNIADQAEQSKMLYRTIRRIWKIQQNDPDHNGRAQIYYSVECNGIGLGILNALEIEYEVRIPGWLIDSRDNKMRGIRLTSANKKNRCLDLAALIERNVFLPRSRQLVSQLKTFVKKRENVYCAKEGSKDDLVMSLVLMMQLIEELRISDYDIQEHLLFEVTDNFDTSDAESYYGSNYKPFCIVG
jgi:hypothetical protein